MVRLVTVVDTDPDLQRTCTGPDLGVGARDARRGNRTVRVRSREITGSTAEPIDFTQVFHKPYAATTSVAFTFTPTGVARPAGPRDEWRRTGDEPTGVWQLMAPLCVKTRVAEAF